MKNINTFIWLKLNYVGNDYWPHVHYWLKDSHRLFADELNTAFRKSTALGTDRAKILFKEFL
jgi:hypothetical protein